MKTLSLLAAALLLTGTAYAQSDSGGSNNSLSSTTIRSPQSTTAHDVTGFTNPYSGPGVTKESINRPPNMHPNLKPQPGGAITDVVKYGPNMISPLAPQSYGMGEKYLSAPDPRADVPQESSQAAHRDAGGIKLFSLEF